MYHVSIWKISCWKHSLRSSETVRIFSGKKSNLEAENEVSMTCYTPQYCTMELESAQFHCNFPFSHCLKSCYRRFQMPSVLLSVEFTRNFVLTSWCFVIYRSTKTPFSTPPQYLWEIFALNRRTLRFLYASLSHIYLSDRALYAVEANRFLTYPLNKNVHTLLTWCCFCTERPFFLCSGSS